MSMEPAYSTTLEINGNKAKMMYFDTKTGWAVSTELELLDSPDPKHGSIRFIDDHHGFLTKTTSVIKLLTKLLKANKKDDTVKLLYHCQSKGEDDPIVQLHVVGQSWYIDIVTRFEIDYSDQLLDEFYDIFTEMLYSNRGHVAKSNMNIVESDDYALHYRLEIGVTSKTAKAEIANYLANSKVFYNLAARDIAL